MSFLFDGTNDNLTGTMTSTYNGEGVTLAVFSKTSAHPLAVDGLFFFGNNSATTPDSHSIRTTSVDNVWTANSENTAGTNGAAQVTLDIDNAWAGIVGVFTNDSLRDCYVQSISNTAQSTATRIVLDVLKYINVGESLGGGQDFTGRLAELAIWNIALSTAQVTSYLAGTVASSIAAANLIGYWPLSSADLTNQGTDAGGDLTAGGNAAFDADHPPISGPLAPIRLIWRV